MAKRFARVEKFSLFEKKALGELVDKCKQKYEEDVKALQGKTTYDYRTKKHVQKKPKQGYLAAAVREFYSDLSNVKHNDPNLTNALKFAKRCLNVWYVNNTDLGQNCYLGTTF